MKRVWALLGCIAVMALAVPSWATIWDFGAPTAPQDNTAVGAAMWAVTEDGLTLTAYGYDIGTPNTPHDLYWKNEGTDEHGIGFTNPATLDHEITLDANSQPANFIQIDLNGLQNIGTPGQIRIQSVTTAGSTGTPEEYDLWGSNTLGDLGTMVATGIGTAYNNVFYDLPDWGTYRYYAVTVTGGLSPSADVLMDSIQSTIPEPGTMALLLLGLPALGLLKRKRFA